MAVCSTAAAVPSCSLRHHRIAADSSAMLSSSISILSAPLRPFSAGARRLSAASQRRIIPKVEAKKQTFSSFDDLLQNCDKPVLVDFYATWCGPCQFMVPVLEQVSEKMSDKIQIVKIDTEKYTEIADRYKIAALPTFIIFKDGTPLDRFEGAFPADQLIQRVENALKVPQ